jgi:glycosyltransferase involved in cell wall biosynthesis
MAMMERVLTAQGFQVETATTDDDGPGRRNGKKLVEALAENNVVRRYFAKRSEFYKISPAFARWIFREVRHYDLVHIHALFSFTSVAAAWASRCAGVPYIVRPLGTLDSYGISNRRPWLKAISLRLIEGPLLRHAAAVHFTSEAEALQARGLGFSFKEAIIPLGVNTPVGIRRDDRRINPPECRLLFLSRIDPKKNLEGLLDAMAILVRETPTLHLQIAGGGNPSYLASLQARAHGLGLREQVTWSGHLQGEAKAGAFSAADVFALPSHSENFGIAAAEALAAGLPCVLGHGVAIAQEVAEADAGVACGTEGAAIADGLRPIISNEQLRRTMSSNASRLAQERYSVDSMGTAMKQLYVALRRPSVSRMS